jgi:hypothetical protein
MQRRKLSLALFAAAALATAALAAHQADAQNGPPMRPTAWADCEFFRSLVAPTAFHPDAGNFDELYGGTTFKDGVPLISESKPGDQDYNGGRWHMNVLKESVDQMKYAGACSVEELDLEDFMSTDMYFECPLRPGPGGPQGR